MSNPNDRNFRYLLATEYELSTEEDFIAQLIRKAAGKTLLVRIPDSDEGTSQ